MSVLHPSSLACRGKILSTCVESNNITAVLWIQRPASDHLSCTGYPPPPADEYEASHLCSIAVVSKYTWPGHCTRTGPRQRPGLNWRRHRNSIIADLQLQPQAQTGSAHVSGDSIQCPSCHGSRVHQFWHWYIWIVGTAWLFLDNLRNRCNQRSCPRCEVWKL